MLRVFFDEPNPSFTCHFDPDCPYFGRPDAPNHRLVKVRRATISKELGNFGQNAYPFAAAAQVNSLWLEIDFDDPEFELAIAKHIWRVLSRRYTRLGQAELRQHCGR